MHKELFITLGMFTLRSSFIQRSLFNTRRIHTGRVMAVEKEPVFILSASRTPIGSFQGSLKKFSATDLGSFSLNDAIDKAGIQKTDIEEVYMGNVVSANVGQAPARQVALKSKLPYSVTCTTINKVCSSGMKSTMMAAQGIQLGDHQCSVAGGMESMSNVPFYLPDMRNGKALGHSSTIDGIIKDGLWDAFDDQHMGMAAEHCAETFNITREEQDAYAIESYKRAKSATEEGRFQEEIVAIEVPQGRGKPAIVVEEDEEFSRMKATKVPELRPAFKKDGTVTAANASSLNDGAASLIMASGKFVEDRHLDPIARILSFTDVEQEPVLFTTAPSLAIPKALEKAGLKIEDIDLFEINEAFSVVALVNMNQLGLSPEKVNVNGGAVSLGHPIGCSGARIITSLIYALRQRQLKYGVAAICNGGGGASAVVIEVL